MDDIAMDDATVGRHKDVATTQAVEAMDLGRVSRYN